LFRVRWIKLTLLALLVSVAEGREWSIHLPVAASPIQALSPDGHCLAMSDTFGPLLIFDTESGVLRRTRTLPTKRVYSLAWSSDGAGLVLGDPDAPDAKALLLLPDRGQAHRRLPGGVHGLAPSPSGRYVASISYDTLWLADAMTGKRLRSFEPPFQTWRLAVSNVRLLAWLPGDCLLVVRGGYGVGVPFEVRQIDPKGRQQLPVIDLPEGFVATCLALNPRGKRLHLGSEDGRLVEVDLEKALTRSERKIGTERIAALAVDALDHLACWQGELIHITKAGQELLVLPGFRSEGIAGWQPMLVWDDTSLLLAGKASPDAWRAERREVPPEKLSPVVPDPGL